MFPEEMHPQGSPKRCTHLGSGPVLGKVERLDLLVPNPQIGPTDPESCGGWTPKDRTAVANYDGMTSLALKNLCILK